MAAFDPITLQSHQRPKDESVAKIDADVEMQVAIALETLAGADETQMEADSGKWLDDASDGDDEQDTEKVTDDDMIHKQTKEKQANNINNELGTQTASYHINFREQVEQPEVESNFQDEVENVTATSSISESLGMKKHCLFKSMLLATTSAQHCTFCPGKE